MTDSFKTGLALGLSGTPLPFAQKETRSEKNPVYGWETLWEGEKQNDITGRFGKLLWLWDNQSTTGVNILSAGDVVRVTVDGTVYVYTVQATQSDSAVEAGNKWLGLLSDSTTITDDGTDFYFFEMYGGLRAYTRTFGTHSVKFERAITDIPVSSIHTARVQGWWLGKRLAGMRGQKQENDNTARLGLGVLGRMLLGKE